MIHGSTWLEPAVKNRYPPMSAWATAVMRFLLSPRLTFARPVSVEGERRRRVRREWVRVVVVLVVSLTLGGTIGRRWGYV